MTGYSPPPPDEVRCRWLKLNGVRCHNEVRRVDGYATGQWCGWHEDAAVARVKNWQRAQYVADVPLEEHLSLELRMSLIQIRELEFQVLDLGLSVDAYETATTETETRSGDDPKNSYVSVKTARLLGAHPVILHYLREREHHMSVVKTCVQAGIAMKQLAVIERYVESMIASQMSLAQALGHDPNDPHVREAIMGVIREQQSQLADLGVAQELEAGAAGGP